MSRRKLTPMEMVSREWARIPRKALGIILPEKMELSEMLGLMRGTLGQVREDGEGASQGTTNQHFPEVFTGDALVVHRARQHMPGPQRLVHRMHFVYWEWPVKLKAAECQMKEGDYFNNLTASTLFLSGFFAATAKAEVDHYFAQKRIST